MPDYVADLGNTRLKVARLESTATGGFSPVGHRAFLLGDPADWQSLEDWLSEQPSSARWLIASVNPPAADRLGRLLDRSHTSCIQWFTSAADVPVTHRLERPDLTGADRALAVLGARTLGMNGTWGLVVSCGTAITVERVLEDGTWDGGAIAPGLSLSARSLGRETALLPTVRFDREAPSWGLSTVPAIEAGVFWGTVGAVRELIARQRESRPVPWIVWTGGDAERLAREVGDVSPLIVPDLVLRGLATLAATGGEPR